MPRRIELEKPKGNNQPSMTIQKSRIIPAAKKEIGITYHRNGNTFTQLERHLAPLPKKKAPQVFMKKTVVYPKSKGKSY